MSKTIADPQCRFPQVMKVGDYEGVTCRPKHLDRKKNTGLETDEGLLLALDFLTRLNSRP